MRIMCFPSCVDHQLLTPSGSFYALIQLPTCMKKMLNKSVTEKGLIFVSPFKKAESTISDLVQAACMLSRNEDSDPDVPVPF